jgi:excisionase family DNA binding protein
MDSHISAAGVGNVDQHAILTVEEVAKELRLSKATVQRLIHGTIQNAPQLPALQVGRRFLVRRESLVRYMEAVEGVHSAT